MALLLMKGMMNHIIFISIFLYCTSYIAAVDNTQYLIDGGTSSIHFNDNNFNLLKHHKQKREVGASAPFTPHDKSSVTPSTPRGENNTAERTTTKAPVPTIPTTTISPAAKVNVTQTPLLGQNGTGIRKENVSNLPKVSDPIQPDDDLNVTDILEETPEKIKAEHNLTNLTYVNHTFYNSTFIGNVNYFDSYWENITSAKSNIHTILSHSHRRATKATLTFPFPYYGQPIQTLTIATGGFIYTGDHVHSWLAATQYIAPLMSNFDTTMTNDSFVKLSDDGTKFTVIWERVTLQEHVDKPFTFAVTLFKNGDIVFAYKTIPIPISDIEDIRHPVKVGISDAYITDNIVYLIRKKTIYEYHRLSFIDHDITNRTILKLTPLPTCPQYTTCESCTNHKTAFDCSWCVKTQRCSNGIDRNKQDWIIRSCSKNPIYSASDCPSSQPKGSESSSNNNSSNGDFTTYDTDYKKNPYHDATFKTANADPSITPRAGTSVSTSVHRPLDAPGVAVTSTPNENNRSPIGAVMAAFVIIVLISSFAAWVLYAFKNPHTRSGQFLIKYRPSQWRWKRGEARYTAATIHM